MATLILKNSSVAAKVPLNSDLVAGEVAINTLDGKLYYKDSGGTVVEYIQASTLVALLVSKGAITQGDADAL